MRHNQEIATTMHRETHERLIPRFALSILLALPGAAWAHAIAGMRVFPATMSFDDPGVANEFSANYGTINAYGVTTDTLSLAYAKTITPRFGLSMATDYNRITQSGAANQSGWDNLTVGGAYQLFVNAPHEAIGMAKRAYAEGRKRLGEEADHVELIKLIEEEAGVEIR